MLGCLSIVSYFMNGLWVSVVNGNVLFLLITDTPLPSHPKRVKGENMKYVVFNNG